MAAIGIRDLDDEVKERLRLRAARNGRSLEAEIRAILTTAVTDDAPHNDLFAALSERFAQLGGSDLGLPTPSIMPRAASLGRRTPSSLWRQTSDQALPERRIYGANCPIIGTRSITYVRGCDAEDASWLADTDDVVGAGTLAAVPAS